MAPRAFQIHRLDNVATLIDHARPGPVQLIGGPSATVTIAEEILPGHKVAVRAIAANEAVVKFGVRIGHATIPIAPGDWVHLHNLASELDERSATLDLHSGAPTDTRYE